MNSRTISIAPEDALRRLREGNRRFRADTRVGTFALEGGASLQELTSRQDPFAAVLGCSDSRVPVEIVFGQGLGQLFVVRVAGNVVAPTQLASLEFAVTQLGVRLIVVLGHSGCGAVAHSLALLARGDSTDPDGHFGSVHERISRAVLATAPGERELGLPDRLPDSQEAVVLNVRQSCSDLGHPSGTLAELLASGTLRVVGAVYHLDSGEVESVEDLRDAAPRGARRTS
jgi:carbonic anhydrase